MVSQMDALQSFTYLTDNIPNWLGQIQELSAHTSERHAEFVAEYTRLLKHAKPKKQKTPSMISQRSEDERRVTRSTTASSHVDVNPLEAGNKYLFASAQKRQKNTGASVRSGASGPSKYRSKQAVIIYYDSHVQNTLESLVKGISTARNNLRKGKRARSLARGPMLSLSSMYRTSPFDPSDKLPILPPSLNPKIGSLQQSTPTGNADESFDLADKDLVYAQNLCETAAHQFLRDGDNRLELTRASEKLQKTLEFAKSTLVSLKEEDENRRKDLEESDIAVDGDCGTGSIDSKADQLKTSSIGNLSPNLPEIPTAKKDDPIAAIEVDDDDSRGYEDISTTLNLSRYRSIMRPSARG